LLPLVAVVAIATASVLPAAASVPVPVPSGAGQAGTRTDGRTAGATAEPRRQVQRAPTPGSVAVRSTRPAAVVPAEVAIPAAKAKVESKAVASSGGSARPAAGYRGTNHMWIPSLGISRNVSFYACSRTSALAHVVYRWGCGGSNNVYLMGHAASVLKPLHDAYVSGRLRKGMQVIYADGNGRVRTYSVSFWKLVRPDGDVAWAYAAQARPSMTLQTCVGSNSEWRLVVRLVATG
jgi:hypothetical protein